MLDKVLHKMQKLLFLHSAALMSHTNTACWTNTNEVVFVMDFWEKNMGGIAFPVALIA